MQVFKWYELFKILDIGRPIFKEIKKIAFPNEPRKNNYTEEEVELLRKVLYNRQKAIKEKKDAIDFIEFEKAKENEFYAKVLKNGENWSVGIFSSTNLNEDFIRFKKKGLDLIVISEEEAKQIYIKLYKE